MHTATYGTIIKRFHSGSFLITIWHKKLNDTYKGEFDGPEGGVTVYDSELPRLRRKMARCIKELRM